MSLSSKVPFSASSAAYGEISPIELARSQFSGRIVDVREPGEFYGELGHLAGAELVPLSTLPTQAARWNRDEPIVLVCRSGRRSGDAARLLAQRGFRHVFNFTGGMLAHNAAGLPTARGVGN